jgi:predicted AAA+ superfamily ATPase
MREAFDFTLEQFIFYGGYPGAAPLVKDEARWAAYVRDALIEHTISKDVLQMAPVQKPALLRRVFDLACRYSGQMLSYQKMMGQLADAGNTTTLAHYLELLEGAGMVCGLQKYAGHGWGFERVRATPDLWGRVVESAVGAELLARRLTHSSTHPALHYWHESGKEVDFVLPDAQALFALEVKSGRQRGNTSGLDAFRHALRRPGRSSSAPAACRWTPGSPARERPRDMITFTLIAGHRAALPRSAGAAVRNRAAQA